MTRQFLHAIFLLTCISLNAQKKVNITEFSSGLDSIRTALKIPGMAVAVMQEGSIVFEDGFGYSDLSQHQKVTTKTCFRIASITKTFTSTLIMQLVGQGKLNLQTPISQFGLDLGDPNITVKNLLTHTSEIEPGRYFQYNGYRYGKLGQVSERASGTPFYKLLMQNIIKPLNMTFTAPGLSIHDSLFDFDAYTKSHPEMLPFFENSFSHLAKAYDVNDKGEIVEIHYLDEFGAFGGLASNVNDLLKYSEAIDRNQFVSAKIQKEIFTPNRTTNGELTPYGLGWFVQNYHGIDYYWHYGQTPGESGLFVKVPGKHLTLVVLANTDKFSVPFPMGDGDLFMSPVGQLFYKYFINEDSAFAVINYSLPAHVIGKKLLSIKNGDYKDFYDKELIVHATMLNFNKDTIKARQLYKLYADLNFNKVAKLPTGEIIAEIKDAGISQDITKAFSLANSQQVRVYGVGENCSGDFSSWCDFGWIENADGKIIWQMQKQPAKNAGGALKNQKVEQVIRLQAGNYKLRYKSDSGHAYNNWDSLPPDDFFWGIKLLKN